MSHKKPLSPITQKSFYKKAFTLEDENFVKLQSYDTIVAEYNKKTKEMKIEGYYSATTARHINAFLNLFGFPKLNKKKIEQLSGLLIN